ncbi:MAG: hypothetical protein HYT62_04790 [Candidatus Yanofskybacteria bacterium]|nr:hypothetical protein [Candidatus Yanofskybacteria bacterium]
MSVFWFSIVFSLLLVGLAIRGGQQIARGERATGYIMISMPIMGMPLLGYLFYLMGIMYASGQPLTWTTIIFP